MKIALYIEDGLEQIVLTPQSDVEKGILGKLTGEQSLEIKRGSFYECMNGYVRYDPFSRVGASRDSSTIIVLRPKPPAIEGEPEIIYETGPASGC